MPCGVAHAMVPISAECQILHAHQNTCHNQFTHRPAEIQLCAAQRFLPLDVQSHVEACFAHSRFFSPGTPHTWLLNACTLPTAASLLVLPGSAAGADVTVLGGSSLCVLQGSHVLYARRTSISRVLTVFQVEKHVLYLQRFDRGTCGFEVLHV